MPIKKAKASEIGGLLAYSIGNADYESACCISVTRAAPGQRPQRVTGWLVRPALVESRLEVFRPLARRGGSGARMLVGTLGAAEATGVEPVVMPWSDEPEPPNEGMKLSARCRKGFSSLGVTGVEEALASTGACRAWPGETRASWVAAGLEAAGLADSALAGAGLAGSSTGAAATAARTASLSA